jgi:predicted HAD superfamily Cof-like phosphohydrolase
MFYDVLKFIHACDQVPTQENSKLYASLITEEYKEFLTAIENNDRIEQLDACMDMIWVILGYCAMNNFNVQGAWNEVAATNLNKIDPNTGKVIKNANGKVMKPDGWQPPNLKNYV